MSTMVLLSQEPLNKKLKLSNCKAVASTEAGTKDGPHAVEAEVEQPRLRCDGKKHVEKGSLTLEALLEAKEAAKCDKPKEDMTEDDKREERRAANRLSAFQSRTRRKVIIGDLQKTVAQLSRENSNQRSTIAQLKVQIDGALKENEFLRSQVVSMGSRSAEVAPPTAPISQNPSFSNILSLLGNKQASTAAPSSGHNLMGVVAELAAIQKQLAVPIPGIGANAVFMPPSSALQQRQNQLSLLRLLQGK